MVHAVHTKILVESCSNILTGLYTWGLVQNPLEVFVIDHRSPAWRWWWDWVCVDSTLQSLWSGWVPVFEAYIKAVWTCAYEIRSDRLISEYFGNSRKWNESKVIKVNASRWKSDMFDYFCSLQGFKWFLLHFQWGSKRLRSGFLSREEFLAIEMRLHYEDGQAGLPCDWMPLDALVSSCFCSAFAMFFSC